MKIKSNQRSKGQILVIFAISLMALLFFVGFALDAGSLYITYGHLKRAVDSAAIAAANEFKRGASSSAMAETAKEVLEMMNTDMSQVDLGVYICDENDNTVYENTATLDGNSDGKRDPHLLGIVPAFYAQCPDWQDNEAAKKLVWVQARQRAPLYFLTLLGFHNISLQTSTISEAAPLDLVIVLDVSESMGYDTVTNNPNKYLFPNNTGGCNEDDSCQPLKGAKDAAIALVDTLYDAIDQVSVVTYSNVAVAHPILNKAGDMALMSDDMENVKSVINSIKLNDDAPLPYIMYDWLTPLELKEVKPGEFEWVPQSGFQKFNYANPEDRDNDGLDADNDLALYGIECPWDTNPELLEDLWWDQDEWLITTGMNSEKLGNLNKLFDLPDDPSDPFKGKLWNWEQGLINDTNHINSVRGIPCDQDNVLDVYDWDRDGKWSMDDHNETLNYLNVNDPNPSDASLNATLAPLSTCIGCGIRTGANVLKRAGRFGSVWVMVFLTDGHANLSDTPATNPDIINPSAYPNGFCNSTLGGPAGGFWDYDVRCRDLSWSPRYCIDASGSTCPIAPTGADWTMAAWSGAVNNNYSALDYARDMTDEAALLQPNNPNEPQGEDIAIYSIGLGDTAGVSTQLLRYMALIGIEGRRDTRDPCTGKADTTWCGQYYYAAGGSDLTPIFEDIASRIFTRISQ